MPGFKVPRCQWVPNHGVVALMAPWHLRFSGSQLVGFSSKSKQKRADFLRFAIENASERVQNGPFEAQKHRFGCEMDVKPPAGVGELDYPAHEWAIALREKGHFPS